MPTSVLLALTSAAADAPACLVEARGVRPIERLASQLREHGPVVVLSPPGWAELVRAHVPDGVGVRVVEGRAHTVAALVELLPVDEPMVVLPSHLVADDVSLAHLADGAVRSTAARVGDVRSDRDGAPVRTSRGRVVAAGSPYHDLRGADQAALGGLRVAPGDREAVGAHLRELATLLGTMPGPWRDRDATVDEDTDPGRELIDLVLVALVRGGSRVAADVGPRGGVWDTPRSAEQLERSLAALESLDEERLRLDTAVKRDDGFFTTYAVSPYSRYWARWAARKGLSPDQVSAVSMAVGVASAAAFAVGDRLWAVVGAVLLQLAFTLDCVDGQLARYARRFSALGGWLDAVLDRAKEYVVFVGLALGAIRAGDARHVWLLAGAALALQTFRHTLDFGYAEQQIAELAAGARRPLVDVGDAGPSRWEAGAVTGSERRRGLPGQAIRLLRRAEAVPVTRWAKRIVVLPIGERFLLISVTAVLAGHRAVFVALLVWGSLATAYTAGGRVLRSFA